MVGYDFIEPLQGGFARDGTKRCFRLFVSPAPGGPTVLIPLLAPPLPSTEHYALEDGYRGTKVEAFNTTMSSDDAGDTSQRRSGIGLKKQRNTAISLLQYQRDYPQMVTQAALRVQEHMCPDAGLFPDSTPLLQAPLAESTPDPRRDNARKQF